MKTYVQAHRMCGQCDASLVNGTNWYLMVMRMHDVSMTQCKHINIDMNADTVGREETQMRHKEEYGEFNKVELF